MDVMKTPLNVDDKELPMPPMWAKWSSEMLKTKKNAELTTPLSNKKNIKTTLGDSVKKY